MITAEGEVYRQRGDCWVQCQSFTIDSLQCLHGVFCILFTFFLCSKQARYRFLILCRAGSIRVRGDERTIDAAAAVQGRVAYAPSTVLEVERLLVGAGQWTVREALDGKLCTAVCDVQVDIGHRIDGQRCLETGASLGTTADVIDAEAVALGT